MSTLTLQPDATAGIDTYLDDKNTSTNYGTNASLLVGNNNSSPDNTCHILLKFDLSSIPVSATIASAQLTMVLNQAGNWRANSNRTLQLSRLIRAWTETGATWNKYDGASFWATAGGTGGADKESGFTLGSVALKIVDPINTAYVIDLDQALVQQWVSGAFANNGLIMTVSTETDDLFSFYSSDEAAHISYRPMLVVTYLIASEIISIGLTEHRVLIDLIANKLFGMTDDTDHVGLVEQASLIDATSIVTAWTESFFESTFLLRVNRQYSTPNLRVQTVNIKDMLNAVDTLACELVDPETAPAIGQEIELLHGVEPHAASRWSQSGLTGYNADHINNGDLSHFCFDLNSIAAGSWLELTLASGASRAFRAVRLYAEGAYQATWDVQYSDNDVDWVTVAADWNSGQDGEFSTMQWADAGPHRFWRLYKTDAAAPGARILEVQWSTEYAMVLFHGTIDDISRVYLEPHVGVIYSLDCVDWNQLAERMLVTEDYNDILAGDIVRDVIADHLADDDVTTALVEDGPTVTKYVANYLTVRQVLNDLAELTGFWWNIDYDKRLHFAAMTTNVAPIVLESGVDGNALSASVSAQTSRDQYRNHQYVRAGHDLSDIQVETFAGDGQRKTFTVGFPVAEVPTISIDGVVKTVGIRGVDTSGFDWYWNKNNTEITQDGGGTALTSAQVLSVSYKGLFPVIVQIKDDAQVSARQAVEGGSGIYQAVEQAEQLDGRSLAMDKTTSLLRKFGRMPTVLSFDTMESGLRAGQLIEINIPELNVSGQWLIQSIDINDLGTDQLVVYRGQAIDGEHLGGWLEFFRRFSNQGGQFIARENEVVSSVTSFFDAVAAVDSLTPTPDAVTTEWEVDVANVDYSEVT